MWQFPASQVAGKYTELVTFLRTGTCDLDASMYYSLSMRNRWIQKRMALDTKTLRLKAIEKLR
jgi:hypothetical protein